jgi:hypothetical protein
MLERISSFVVPAPVRWAFLIVLAVVSFSLGEIDGQQRAGRTYIDYLTAQAKRTAVITQAQTKVVVQTEIQYRDRIKTVYLKGEVIENVVV